jgi:hypothetical protein
MKKESLKEYDVLVACKLYAHELSRREWTYYDLSQQLGLSASSAHEAVDRCRCSGLLLPSREVSRKHLRDLLVVAVPRIFYATRGSLASGMPTSVHAAPIRGRFNPGRGDRVAVWPLGEGEPGRAGEAVVPLYPSAPMAAARDAVLYELLALVDVLRVGGPSERERAVELLDERLGKRSGDAA